MTPRRRTLLGSIAVLTAAVALTGAIGPRHVGNRPVFADEPSVLAQDDLYNANAGEALTVNAGSGVLSNDRGTPLAFVTHTEPAHGKLTLNPDGSFSYTATDGYSGPDSFTYTVSDAVKLYKDDVKPLTTVGGVTITGGSYGSSVAAVPGSSDEFYGLTDRGPNVVGPNASSYLPLPDFDPAIGKFRLQDGVAHLEKTIPLQSEAPYSGRVNLDNSTSETLRELNGNLLPPDKNGYDSEGLVAMPDGSFWVSDEYGPFITHFDQDGREIKRLSPVDGTLPTELINRVANRGMEGLTITPDGSMLVGTMQNALQQPDLPTGANGDGKKIAIVRLVTYKIATGEEHEYLYTLDNPATNATAVSEIAALSNTQFIVIERDGLFAPKSYKKFWKIDISSLTDIGPSAKVAGAKYSPAMGLTVGDKSLELLVNGQNTADATATMTKAGIKVASRSVYLDLIDLLTKLDPKGSFFSHDKVEGMVPLDGGKHLLITNDSDFGIDGTTGTSAPLGLHVKASPVTGVQDDGEFLIVDMTKLPAMPSTATVMLNVSPASAGVPTGPTRAAQ